jgi:hypothetical protein
MGEAKRVIYLGAGAANSVPVPLIRPEHSAEH